MKIAIERSPNTTEAWIIGSGMSALASAVYLIKIAKVPPQRVHIWDHNVSLGNVIQPEGDPVRGYDQFGGCLPAPVGAPLRELLALVPSAHKPATSQSVLDDIVSREIGRNRPQKNQKVAFLIQKKGKLESLSSHSSIQLKDRQRLARFLLTCERRMKRKRICDFFPESFFQSFFWGILSIQFGFQPWHGAAEFKRAVRQYLHEFHSLSILRCLDITGYYQFEYLFMPIYLHLLELGVDYQFNVQIRAIGLSQVNKQQRMVTRLDFAHNGFEVSRTLQWSDIVIATVGSTISGCFVGADNRAPGLPELDVTGGLDENWSVWLELANKVAQFGNPYNFCTRSSESMLESFTITTEDLELYDKLNLLSLKKSAVGTVIALIDSHWKLNVCVPLQPVFSNQPTNQRVLWGYAGSPRSEGNYVKKAMVDCSGSEILSELLAHLNIRSQPSMRRTITIPRVLPRMTAHLLSRSPTDRLDIIPKTAVNIGLVGPFVNIPYYTAADISYGVRSARVAVSRLMGLSDYDDEDVKNKYLGTVLLNALKVIF